MIPIDSQVSRSKFKVKGQASLFYYVGKGGISFFLQTSLIYHYCLCTFNSLIKFGLMGSILTDKERLTSELTRSDS